MTDHGPNTGRRALAESFAIAYLQWPALIGALHLGGQGWALALKVVLWAWVILVSLGLILGRKPGPKWGLTMTLCAVVVAAAAIAAPSPWLYLWLALLPITFHSALRARLDESAAAAE